MTIKQHFGPIISWRNHPLSI